MNSRIPEANYCIWNIVISEVNSGNLSKDNVIEKIKNALKEHLREEYNLWEEEKFDINYDFYVRNGEKRRNDDFFKTTILNYASRHNEEGQYNKLIMALAEIGAKVGWDDFGMSALHYAAEQGHADVVNKLIKEKAGDVDEKIRYEKTPLHYAVGNGHTEVVEALIKAGANVLATTDDDYDGTKETPLHYAAKNGHMNIVEILLSYEVLLGNSVVEKPENITSQMSEFWDQCVDNAKNEIAKLKEEEIGKNSEGIITLYDIISTKDINQLARYFRNENVRHYLENGNYKEKFSKYTYLIERQYQRGNKRKELLDRGSEIFCKYIFSKPDSIKLSLEIAEKIIENLHDYDIKAVMGGIIVKLLSIGQIHSINDTDCVPTFLDNCKNDTKSSNISYATNVVGQSSSRSYCIIQ